MGDNEQSLVFLEDFEVLFHIFILSFLISFVLQEKGLQEGLNLDWRAILEIGINMSNWVVSAHDRDNMEISCGC